MDTTYSEFAVSAITFVLNSAVLSSFIIPEVRKLKEIKDGLFKYRIPYAPTNGTFPAHAAGSKTQEEEVERLQTQLDVYAVRVSELKSVTNNFYYSVLAALTAILTIVIFPSQKDVVFVLHPIVQLVILILAIKGYVSDPDRVASPEYLVQNCEVNIHSLVQALDMSVSYDAGKMRVNSADPINFNLSLKLRIYGFRFAFVLADENQKVCFLSYGPVNGKTELWRHILHPSYGKAEYDRIPIGSFKLNSYAQAKNFDVYFLVFMPVYPKEITSPMFGEGSVEVPGNANSLMIGGGCASISEYGAQYRGITFKGSGEKIADLKIDDGFAKPQKVINEVFKKYGEEFGNTPKIKTYESYSGDGIV